MQAQAIAILLFFLAAVLHSRVVHCQAKMSVLFTGQCWRAYYDNEHGMLIDVTSSIIGMPIHVPYLKYYLCVYMHFEQS